MKGHVLISQYKVRRNGAGRVGAGFPIRGAGLAAGVMSFSFGGGTQAATVVYEICTRAARYRIFCVLD